MKRRCIYIEEVPWARARLFAAKKGETVSEYVRQALELQLKVDATKKTFRRKVLKRLPAGHGRE